MRCFVWVMIGMLILSPSGYAEKNALNLKYCDELSIENTSDCNSISNGELVLFYGDKGISTSGMDTEELADAPWDEAFASCISLEEKQTWTYTYNSNLPYGSASFKGAAILEEQILLLKQVADTYAEKTFYVTVLNHAGEFISENALPAEFRPVDSCSTSRMLLMAGYWFEQGLRYPALMAYGKDGKILWQFVLKEHKELEPDRLNTYCRIACDNECIWVQWENEKSSIALQQFSMNGTFLAERTFHPSRFYEDEILVCGEYVMVRGGEQHLAFVLYTFDPVINNWRILRTPLDESEYVCGVVQDGDAVRFITSLNHRPCRIYTFDPASYTMKEENFAPSDVAVNISYAHILQNGQLLLCGKTREDFNTGYPFISIWEQE